MEPSLPPSQDSESAPGQDMEPESESGAPRSSGGFEVKEDLERFGRRLEILEERVESVGRALESLRLELDAIEERWRGDGPESAASSPQEGGGQDSPDGKAFN